MSQFIYLPVKEESTGRVGFTRKAVADLVGKEREYHSALTALGPRPDKDIDGSLEYDAWQAAAGLVARTYLSQC